MWGGGSMCSQSQQQSNGGSGASGAAQAPGRAQDHLLRHRGAGHPIWRDYSDQGARPIELPPKILGRGGRCPEHLQHTVTSLLWAAVRWISHVPEVHDINLKTPTLSVYDGLGCAASSVSCGGKQRSPPAYVRCHCERTVVLVCCARRVGALIAVVLENHAAQNVDSHTHNVRLRQPKNISVWSVDPPTMNVRLAPGMETTVQVSCCCASVSPTTSYAMS
jgi:hypothetical protein